MAAGFKCDRCLKLIEGCPSEAPTISIHGNRAWIERPFFRLVNEKRYVDLCYLCLAETLRDFASEIEIWGC